MIKFKPRKREPFRLDLVPMINIVFLLLIFFMLTSTAMKQPEDIQLPEAKTAEMITTPNLVVLITATGGLQFDGKMVSQEDLLSLMEMELRDHKEKVVEIQADQNVPFESFGQVIDISKQAGAVDFILATEEAESVSE